MALNDNALATSAHCLKIDQDSTALALFVDSGQSRFDDMIDMSNISAGNPAFKFTFTSDTPVTTWTAGTPNNNPDGYIEIQNGAGATRYIPVWT